MMGGVPCTLQGLLVMDLFEIFIPIFFQMTCIKVAWNIQAKMNKPIKEPQKYKA